MINYFFEDIDQINIPDTITFWLENIISSEKKRLGTINYIFCDDEYILKVNREYLQHDYFTDVITFDYAKGSIISGDIFVSLPRIIDNSSTLSKDFNDEFNRVLAHGILHIIGYKDKTESDQIKMREKEDFYLSKIIKP